MVGVRQFDEAETLERALALFWAKGYASTSMQDLAEATGVLRGSLYNAYKDKESLFLAAYERYRARLLREAEAALAAPTAREAIEQFFKWSIRSMTTGTPARGCLTTKTATDHDADSERIRAALRDFLDTLEAAVRRRLAEAGSAERLALPPSEAARLVIAMTRGIVVLHGVYQDKRRLQDSARTLLAVLFPDAR